MCGIFGIVSNQIQVNGKDFIKLANHAKQRGRDSSGILFLDEESYYIKKADFTISDLISDFNFTNKRIILGHSRLITNGLSDNQPVIKDNVAVLHNGIIVNADSIWNNLNSHREFEIDSEIIAGIALEYL